MGYQDPGVFKNPTYAPGPYNECTQCEEYGHRHYDRETCPGMRVCSDCGNEYMEALHHTATSAQDEGQVIIDMIAAQIAHNNKVLADA